MSDEKLIEVFVNPLQFLEADEPWAELKIGEANHESVLNFMCTPGIGSDSESIISRYKEISIENPRLFAAPNEQRILDKLVWPLRHAKANYMCGNFLGTVALCGMVAEMVAILLFEMSDFSLNSEPMLEGAQKALFGSTFERLGQDRRVKILSAYRVINDGQEDAFEVIRLTRRRYLHLWSQDHEELSQGAIKCFQSAVLLVTSAIGQDIDNGKLRLNPALVKYLERQGVYAENDEAGA